MAHDIVVLILSRECRSILHEDTCEGRQPSCPNATDELTGCQHDCLLAGHASKTIPAPSRFGLGKPHLEPPKKTTGMACDDIHHRQH